MLCRTHALKYHDHVWHDVGSQFFKKKKDNQREPV